MDEFKKLVELADSPEIKLSQDFKNLLHTHLVLGQTRHVCRHGTLSEGHDKITPAQRYYQAMKEMYYLSGAIQDFKAAGMEAQADLLDAEGELKYLLADEENRTADILRAEAKLLRAQRAIVDNLVSVEDRMRMVDEYNKVRLELKDYVESKYPEGIEQAEMDNWTAVHKWKALRQKATGTIERVTNICLPPEVKALEGIKMGKLDSAAALLAANDVGHLVTTAEVVDKVLELTDKSEHGRLTDENKKSTQKRLDANK